MHEHPDEMTKPRVLIADASMTFRALLRREFDPDHFEVYEVADGEEAIRVAAEVRPTIATLSIILPRRDGIDACSTITSQEATAGTTVIMITSNDSQNDRARAFEAGAVHFLEKGFPAGSLSTYAEEIVRTKNQLADLRVLVVDDNAFIRTTLSRLLMSEGATVFTADDGQPGLKLLAEEKIDIILTDYVMPEMDGIEFVRTLRQQREHASTPVLFVSVAGDRETAVRALDAGANDFIRKPFEATELIARLRSFARLAELTAKLEVMARTDELTGLWNRREALTKLGEMCELATRYKTPFACIMLDIDHFKRFNDAHGHDVGDMVLTETAKVLRDNVRVMDAVCRFGGEEFLILCPQTPLDGAAACAEKLRTRIEEHVVAHDGEHLKVTVSLGVAEHSRHMPGPEAVLKIADRELYVAKESGRNRVSLGRYEPTAAAVGAAH